MIRLLRSRLVYTLPVLWLVVSVVFLLIHLVPGDPIQAMLGEGAASADIQAARRGGPRRTERRKIAGAEPHRIAAGRRATRIHGGQSRNRAEESC